MAECQQTPVGEVPNTHFSDMVMPNQVEQEPERNQRQGANISKGHTIVPSKQKGKNVAKEVLEEYETKERPWLKVGANGRLSRFHMENVPLQHIQELIGSSSNHMGLSKVIPNQSKGKSKPWHRFRYQSNQGSQLFNLRFDKTGNLISPLDQKQPWKGGNSRAHRHQSITNYYLCKNAFAVLSDYFGDTLDILAQRERDQGRRSNLISN
jgi:hypothetical protein